MFFFLLCFWKEGTLLTKLEVGVVGADMVASTEDTFHDQSYAHGIEKAKVLGDPIVLEGKSREGPGRLF